jgi:beta-N-acetylhexosaminidase
MTNKDPIASILSKAPFALAAAEIDWVRQIFSELSQQEKICQLINLQIMPGDEAGLQAFERHPLGAVSMIHFSDPVACQATIARLKSVSRIAPLISADLEGGVTSGRLTSIFPNQLGCAAANCLSTYGQALEALSSELKALGIHWTFSPVLDVNHSFQSAIVGTRSYGSEPALISEMAQINIDVFQRNGIATTAKHWPGEGYDDRDQHLVTTINPLTMSDWQDVFGRLYSRAIDSGVLSIMSAHIALPAYAQGQGEVGVELYRPASISKHLNQRLLRRDLGFNGLIVSDATLMGGLESWGPRHQWLPEVIENGCDMMLFSESLTEDINTLQDALEKGLLSHKRLDEAVIRVLGLKAKLGLHRQSATDTVDHSNIDLQQHKEVMSRLSDLSITCVKDTRAILPLNLERYRRIWMFKEENVHPLGADADFRIGIDEALRAEGFEVHVFDPAVHKLDDCANADLIVYAIAQESLLTKSRLFLDWAKLHGGTFAGMRRLWWDKPTMLISFGHPYYLYDAPRMPCLINAYTATPQVQSALIEKLMGRSAFTGKSPVDAMCGLPDAIY